jgi:peptidoglycan/xylan/chitin deacetylase (PgdA/CDA1 family)
VQIGWLKRHVRTLSEAELIEGLRSGRGPGEMSVLITTDDGYRDNYTRAFPVLNAHGVPAIFFVPSALIESRHLGWWDQLAYILKHTARTQVTYDGHTLDLAGRRAEAFAFLSRKIIDRMPDGTAAGLDEIRGICAVDAPSLEDQSAELMTWEQLREIRADGIAIGSHAHSHVVLSRLDIEQQREELRRSRDLITQRIGGSVRSIAYPTGGQTHFTADTQRIAKESGYEAGFSFHSGYNRWPTMNAFDIKRATVNYHDQIGVAGAAILPELLSSPF